MGGMQAITNMSGIITVEVGKGVGSAMQTVARSSPTQASSSGSGDDLNPTPKTILQLY